MYLNYNGTDYPCKCRPGATMVYRGLPEDFPAPVAGVIVLCADDGFILRTDNSADYLRQTFADGVLTLTNVPEPELEPDIPEEPEDDSLSARVAALEEEAEQAKIDRAALLYLMTGEEVAE